MRSNYRSLAVWAIALGSIFLLLSLRSVRPDEGREVSFSKLMETIHELDESGDALAVLTVEGMDWRLELEQGGEILVSTGPVTEKFVDEVMLAHKGMQVNLKKAQEPGFLQTFLVSWLPTLLLLGFLFMFLRNLQSGSGKAMSFGKNKARMLTDDQNTHNFNDVAGCDEAKQELAEVVHFLRDPKKFTRLGGKLPKGVLLMGSPGTGKTLLAKAVAGEAGVPFFTISGSDFVEMFVGVGASRVRDLFEQAKKHAPCIVFIDEIDAVGRHRGAGMGGGHDEREQTLNQLLVEMDGFESNEGIIIIAGTNRPDVLDPALLRPGRFDRRVTVPLPDLKGREAILKVHTKEVPLSPSVDIAVIARSTPGFSGADLANLVNESALLAAVQNAQRVEPEHVESARDKITMGSARRSMVMSADQSHATAVHEAGHAVVAFFTEGADPLHKVTIIPHGRALGVTMQLPDEDRYCVNRKDVLTQIKVLLGGFLAEKKYFGPDGTTSGVSNDLQRAKDLATRMVSEFGMSSLGPIFYGSDNEEVFLGRQMTQRPNGQADATLREVDQELRKIIEGCYEVAERLLEDHSKELELLTAALTSHETVSGKEISYLFEHGEMPERPVVPLEVNEAAAETPAADEQSDTDDSPAGDIGGRLIPNPA
jgi:cell division protease FtsH